MHNRWNLEHNRLRPSMHGSNKVPPHPPQKLVSIYAEVDKQSDQNVLINFGFKFCKIIKN